MRDPVSTVPLNPPVERNRLYSELLTLKEAAANMEEAVKLLKPYDRLTRLRSWNSRALACYDNFDVVTAALCRTRLRIVEIEANLILIMQDEQKGENDGTTRSDRDGEGEGTQIGNGTEDGSTADR